MSATLHTLSDDTFEQFISNATAPVLVDFWAEWCPPCKALEPALYELAAEYEHRIQVAKVNVDHCPAIAQQYNIRGIPTLLLFADGKLQNTRVGAMSVGMLKAFIDETIRD